MAVLFIVSAEEGAGKTALCGGLAVNFIKSGKTLGYLKSGKNDGDVAFMKRVAGSAGTIESATAVSGEGVVLVEASLGPKVSDAQAALALAKKMDARVVAIEAFTGQASKQIEVYKWFGGNFVGVVLNKVPAGQLKSVKEKAAANFSAAGLKLLGAIPENRSLLSVSVGEIAEAVKGKILNNPEKSGELVENYMLGAMVVGSAIPYFERKTRKAAIIHQDRSDMQLAALETPTQALVLSGRAEPPTESVMSRARARGVPVIATDSSTPEIIAEIEGLLSTARVSQEKKLEGLGDLVKQNIDIKVLA
ncbi:MAG TPA: DRTGG domain-containing protein [Dehalococcoidales bacterium]|nr:DRTGG domain-containing protein [Dehalococcoidales bacterium]